MVILGWAGQVPSLWDAWGRCCHLDERGRCRHLGMRGAGVVFVGGRHFVMGRVSTFCDGTGVVTLGGQRQLSPPWDDRGRCRHLGVTGAGVVTFG